MIEFRKYRVYLTRQKYLTEQAANKSNE